MICPKKIASLRYLFALFALLLSCCSDSSSVEIRDFTAEELKDLSPVKQFIGNKIPKACLDTGEVFAMSGCNVDEITLDYTCHGPYYRLACDSVSMKTDFVQAANDMGWEGDNCYPKGGDLVGGGRRFDCYQIIDNRLLHLYFRQRYAENWNVFDYDNILIWVEYAEDEDDSWYPKL